jgi:uncharacterized protein with PIN domain
MLKRLGRYLRAAGYDTAIIEPGVSDDLTIQQAEEEDRILLTCDRELAGRVGHRAILLPSNGLDNAAQGLGGGEVMLCEECGRLYWPGSHVRRMQAKLESWRVR